MSSEISLKNILDEFEGKDSEELKNLYKSYIQSDDLSDRQAAEIKAIYQLLKERDERIPAQEEIENTEREEIDEGSEKENGVKGKEDEVVSVRDKLDRIIAKIDQEGDKEWRYTIVSGPVLGGQNKLQSKLNRLGRNGWELVDTQRHSVMGKQQAVCFLKKKK